MVLRPSYSMPEAYRENATCLILFFFFFPCRINPFLFIFLGEGREDRKDFLLTLGKRVFIFNDGKLFPGTSCACL